MVRQVLSDSASLARRAYPSYPPYPSYQIKSPPVRTKHANLLARSVRYIEAGEGTPLVWLHAFPLSADQWLPQLHQVPTGWRFIAPDLRGFRGPGDVADDIGLGPMTIDDYAADVLEFMAHVDALQATVGGLSMGGYVALAMARRAPTRVKGLVLSSTRAGADSQEGRVGRDRMVDLVEREGPAGIAKQMVPKLLAPATLETQPDLAEVVGGLIEANSAMAIRAALLAMKDRPNAGPTLGDLDCPVTIIHGADDQLIPVTEAEAMAAAIAGSRLTILPDAGHLPNLEAPVAFSRVIADAL